ncbi:MAG TPA: oligosaccharide flippase family protein [Thermoanaerobaculia bacterium]|nr:oligosaccharide flippase family protein [Thermoanaerobaculia bacterium]
MVPETAAIYGDVSSTGVLDRTIARGVTWTAGIKAATVVVSWACTIVLARILNPQDYGIATMATVYVGLTSMVTDFGLGAAVIALPDLSEKLAAQLHTAACAVGGIAFAISCILAVPVSRFFKTPNLVPVIIVVSTLLIFDSIRLVPTARLGRELRLKDLALLDGYRAFIALVLAVPLALLGARYWTLVVGNVVAALVVTAVVLARVPQRFARPVFHEVKPTLKFSSHFLTNQLAWYGYTNADFMVAGRILGKVALGEYNLAWLIVCAPGDKILSIFGRVMPMVLANVQRDVQALRRYFLLFTEVLGILIIPTAVGLALVARDFVFLVFGAKWAAAVVPLQLLSIFIAIHVVGTPTDRLLQSIGQASFPARLRMVMLVVLPTAFYLSGSRWGTAGIAAMWILVYPLLLVPMFARAFRSVGISVRGYAATLAPTLLSTGLMVLVVFGIRMLPQSPLAARFALEVACGAITFVGSAMLIQRRRLGMLADFVRTIRN